MASKEFQLPAGFSYVRETTKVGDVEYAIEYPTSGGSLQAWLDHFRAQGLDPEKTAAEYIDEVQSQRASQGGKGAVRNAADEVDEQGNVVRSADEVRADAISKHQKNARTFLLGKPRTRAVGGVTQKKQQEIGARVMQLVASGAAVTPDKLAEIAAELGIDPALFAATQG